MGYNTAEEFNKKLMGMIGIQEFLRKQQAIGYTQQCINGCRTEKHRHGIQCNSLSTIPVRYPTILQRKKPSAMMESQAKKRPSRFCK